MTSLKNTMVIGPNVLFASLNQINENAQNIIEKITEPYILRLLFIGVKQRNYRRAKLILKIVFDRAIP